MQNMIQNQQKTLVNDGYNIKATKISPIILREIINMKGEITSEYIETEINDCPQSSNFSNRQCKFLLGIFLRWSF